LIRRAVEAGADQQSAGNDRRVLLAAEVVVPDVAVLVAIVGGVRLWRTRA
jgi:hypothetical protein